MIVMFIFTVEGIILFFLIRFVYSMLRAFFIKRETLSKLNALCKRKGYKTERHRGMLSTMLTMPKKTDMTVRTPEKEYRIRFITCRYRFKSYHFATVEHIVTWFPQVIKMISKKSDSFYKIFTSYRYCPRLRINESEDERVENILIFDPSPLELTKANEHGFHIPVEDGDKIGPYTAYRAKAFLVMLSTSVQSIE